MSRGLEGDEGATMAPRGRVGVEKPRIEREKNKKIVIKYYFLIYI